MALLRKPVVAVAAAKLNEEMGEFNSLNKKLTPETKGKGSQIQVYVNRPSAVLDGVSIPQGFDQGSEKQVNVLLTPKFTTKWVNTIEKTNDILDEEEQILGNMRVGLQRRMKKDFLNLGLATSQINISGTTNKATDDPIRMADIARAIALVSESGVGGKTQVLCPEYVGAIAAGSQWAFFTQEGNDKLFKNTLGSFYGATWHKTNVSGYRAPLAGGAMTLTAPLVEGDTNIQITFASNPGTIPAGTQFQIAGTSAVNVYGDTLPYLATFAAIADVVVTGTTAVIPIGKPIFTAAVGSGATSWQNVPTNSIFAGGYPFPVVGGLNNLANVSNLGTTGAAITSPNAGKNSLVVYSDIAMAFAAASPQEMARKEEYLIRPDGAVPILVGVQGTNESGVANYRMDVIYGMSGIYPQGAITVSF